MAWNFCKGKPINTQIADKIALDILNGVILPGQRLPGITDMSRITGASAVQVKEAYTELVNENIVTVHGDILIIPENTEKASIRRNKLAKEVTDSYIANMTALGFSRKETLAIIGKTLVEMSRSAKTEA